MTEMDQVVDQMRQMQAVSEQLAAQLQAMQQQNVELAGRVQAGELAAASGGGGGGHGGGFASLASKWAPGDFSGEHADWRDWNIKFKAYMGAQLRGEVGRWLAHVDANRVTSAKVAVLGEASRATSSMMHGALIATCLGKSLVIAQRAGA